MLRDKSVGWLTANSVSPLHSYDHIQLVRSLNNLLESDKHSA